MHFFIRQKSLAFHLFLWSTAFSSIFCETSWFVPIARAISKRWRINLCVPSEGRSFPRLANTAWHLLLNTCRHSCCVGIDRESASFPNTWDRSRLTIGSFLDWTLLYLSFEMSIWCFHDKVVSWTKCWLSALWRIMHHRSSLGYLISVLAANENSLDEYSWKPPWVKFVLLCTSSVSTVQIRHLVLFIYI